MHIGEPLRTILVEPLELPVDAPVTDPEPEPEPLEPAPANISPPSHLVR